MALIAKIRRQISRSQYANVLLAVCFLAAQLVPTGFAVAASIAPSDYVIICTVDGFKKVPARQIGPSDGGTDPSDRNMPEPSECLTCMHVCANSISESAPHTAVIIVPQASHHELVLDGGPIVVLASGFSYQTAPRAPPYFL